MVMKEMEEKCFSIIVSAYNVERYLKDTIDSVINQSIGFNQIELILINDGSTDKTLEICQQYEMRWPDNVMVINNPHQGISKNRNVGLQLATGKYISFLDADDKYSVNTLEHVSKFFDDNKEINIIAIPVMIFEKRSGVHPKYELLGNKTRLIDLTYEPFNYVTSVGATFYRRNIIKDKRFNETMYANENTLFNLELFLDNPIFGYIANPDVIYYYRIRKDRSDVVNTNPDNELYTSLYTLYENIKGRKEENPGLIEEAVLYSMKRIVNGINTAIMEEKVREELKGYYRDLLSSIDIKKMIHPVFHNNFTDIANKLSFLNKDKPINKLFKVKDNNIYYNNIKLSWEVEDLNDNEKALLK